MWVCDFQNTIHSTELTEPKIVEAKGFALMFLVLLSTTYPDLKHHSAEPGLVAGVTSVLFVSISLLTPAGLQWLLALCPAQPLTG